MAKEETTPTPEKEEAAHLKMVKSQIKNTKKSIADLVAEISDADEITDVMISGLTSYVTTLRGLQQAAKNHEE